MILLVVNKGDKENFLAPYQASRIGFSGGKIIKKNNLQSYVIKNEKNLQKCDAFTYTCNIDLKYIVPNIDLENIFSKEVNMKYKIM